MANKNFNIDAAHRLRLIYKKERLYAKERLVEQLISWQYFFGTKSIVGITISLPSYYQRKTVEIVCNDLGYTLTSFSNPLQRGLYGATYGKGTNFTFTSADG